MEIGNDTQDYEHNYTPLQKKHVPKVIQVYMYILSYLLNSVNEL